MKWLSLMTPLRFLQKKLAAKCEGRIACEIERVQIRFDRLNNIKNETKRITSSNSKQVTIEELLESWMADSLAVPPNLSGSPSELNKCFRCCNSLLLIFCYEIESNLGGSKAWSMMWIILISGFLVDIMKAVELILRKFLDEVYRIHALWKAFDFVKSIEQEQKYTVSSDCRLLVEVVLNDKECYVRLFSLSIFF